MGEQGRRTLLLPVLAVLWNQLVYYGGLSAAWNAHHRCLAVWADGLVPFLPWTVSIYFGCFLFWAAAYLVLAGGEKGGAFRFFLADLLAKGVCLLFFLLLPTTMPRPHIYGASIWAQAMRFLYEIDAPYNLFPSIHCLVSWLCFIGVRRRRGTPRPLVWGTGLAAGLICLSTLTTRQHVMADVAGGILLAELSYRAAGHPALLAPFSRCMDRLTAK